MTAAQDGIRPVDHSAAVDNAAAHDNVAVHDNAAAHDNVAVHDLTRRHQSTGRSLLFSLLGARDVEWTASGPWVQGTTGERYLDLGSYGVFLLGHRHERVVRAVHEQLDRLPGTSRAFPTEVSALAAAALADCAPDGLSKVMVLNSGAEAVEAALKLSRAATGRTTVAHLAKSFHGKTIGALSLTDAAIFRQRLGPLLADVVRLPRDDPEQAARIIRETRPAAVFAEPVQGEGGVFPLSAEFAASLRRACDEAGALLVFDEIQAGLGRTGDLWAHIALGVRPDVMTVGKALGGGVMPVSALVATPVAFRPYDVDPLLHTSTFGGNPLSSAAMAASIEVIRADDVPGRAAAVGAGLAAVLTALVAEWPQLFSSVSGRGAFLGLHCNRPDVAAEMMHAALAERVLLTACLTTPSVLRFTPSAFATGEDISFAAEALRRAAHRAALEIASDL